MFVHSSRCVNTYHLEYQNKIFVDNVAWQYEPLRYTPNNSTDRCSHK